MRIKTEEKLFHGRRCIRCTAIIMKSKKVGIPFTRQKGWKIYPVLSMTALEARPLFIPSVMRWRDQMMRELFGNQEAPEKFKQMEYL